jgi:hypothetical protein
MATFSGTAKSRELARAAELDMEWFYEEFVLRFDAEAESPRKIRKRAVQR